MVPVTQRVPVADGNLLPHSIGRECFVRHFHWISIAMVIAGVVLAVLAVALPLDRFLILLGAMLVISGVVKLVVLRLWRELVQPGQGPSPLGRRGR